MGNQVSSSPPESPRNPTDRVFQSLSSKAFATPLALAPALQRARLLEREKYSQVLLHPSFRFFVMKREDIGPFIESVSTRASCGLRLLCLE